MLEIDSKEAARRLGISRQRVIQLVESGRLPATKRCCGPRGKFRIKVEDLELVRERKVGRPKK